MEDPFNFTGADEVETNGSFIMGDAEVEDALKEAQDSKEKAARVGKRMQVAMLCGDLRLLLCYVVTPHMLMLLSMYGCWS